MPTFKLKVKWKVDSLNVYYVSDTILSAGNIEQEEEN